MVPQRASSIEPGMAHSTFKWLLTSVRILMLVQFRLNACKWFGSNAINNFGTNLKINWKLLRLKNFFQPCSDHAADSSAFFKLAWLWLWCWVRHSDYDTYLSKVRVRGGGQFSGVNWLTSTRHWLRLTFLLLLTLTNMFLFSFTPTIPHRKSWERGMHD